MDFQILKTGGEKLFFYFQQYGVLKDSAQVPVFILAYLAVFKLMHPKKIQAKEFSLYFYTKIIP